MSKFQLPVVDNSKYVTALAEGITAFSEEMAKVGDRKSQLSRIVALRTTLENNAELLKETDALAAAYLRAIQEITNKRGDLLPALFKSFKNVLSGIKDERDSYLTTETLQVVGSDVDLTEMQAVREQLVALYNFLCTTDADLSAIPIKTSVKTKNVFLDIPQMPKGPKQNRTEATHKFLWTIDGKQFSGRTFAQIRKEIGEFVKVQDIRAALGERFSIMSTSNYSFRMNENGAPVTADKEGKDVNLQVVKIETLEIPAPVVSDEDDEDEVDEGEMAEFEDSDDDDDDDSDEDEAE